MIRLLYFALAALVVACGSSSTKIPFSDPKPLPFQGAGHEQYFLPELPHWANGSVSAGCQRAFSVRFLDYSALARLQGLSFVQSVELQSQFNLRWRERFAGKKALVLTPQEEATLFLETLGQVKGGLKEMRYPAHSPLNLVWWDSVSAKPKLKAWLLNLANQGRPTVLVSLCEGSDSIEAWLEKEELDSVGFFTFGAEALGPTRADGTVVAGTVAPLDAFFEQKRTTLWMSGFIYPAEFPTGYNVKTLED